MSRTTRTLTAATAVVALTALAGAVAPTPAHAIEPPTGRANVFVQVAHTSPSPTPTIVQVTSDRAATATVSRTSRGSYTVTLGNVTGSKGNAQLFMNHRTDQPVDAICSITSVAPSSTRTRIRVKCFDALTGRTTDAADFAISYASRNITDSVGTVPSHFTLTSASATANHTPSTQFRSDTSASKAKVTRTATGVYSVRIPVGSDTYPAAEGVVFTTAVATASARYCNPMSWNPDNSVGPDGQHSVIVTVGCFARTGVPANSRFSMVLSLGNQYGLQLQGGAQWVPGPWSDTPAGTYAFGWNPESYNQYARMTVLGEVVEAVTFNDLLTGHSPRMEAYAVSGYGGNQRCAVVSAGGGPGLLDASVTVQCRNSEGTEIEAGFSTGYVV